MGSTKIVAFILLLESLVLLFSVYKNVTNTQVHKTTHMDLKNHDERPSLMDSESYGEIHNHEEWHTDPTKPKKTIKLKVVNGWGPDPTIEKPNCGIPCKYLKRVYNLNFTEDPDFVFYSIGKNHNDYNNCVKVFFTGENLAPNFNYCDYAISLYHIEMNGRHFRYSPLIDMKQFYGPLNSTIKIDRNMTKRKFCNFIYGDNNQNLEGVRLRGEFFELLSKYKHVDAPGKVHNNMKDAITSRNGNWHTGKLDFIKDYKFTIAFENSNTDGYTTEKLPDALFAHSIPIYFGNPRVGLEYNKKAFIHVNDYNSLEDVVKKVIELDNDDDAYMAMLNEPPLLHPEYDYDEELTKFLTKIIERGNKPFTKDPFGFEQKFW